jgi:hypothetical protein
MSIQFEPRCGGIDRRGTDGRDIANVIPAIAKAMIEHGAPFGALVVAIWRADQAQLSAAMPLR